MPPTAAPATAAQATAAPARRLRIWQGVDRPSRPRLLLATVAILAAIVLAGASGLAIAPLRAAAGIPLALWLPGASLLLAVRPRFVTPIAGAVLALPLSVAMLAVVGVVLDRTPLGLGPIPLALGTVLPSVVLLLIADAREAGEA